MGLAIFGISFGFLLAHHSRVRAVSHQQAVEGQQFFNQSCITCHGPGGNGAGGAPNLNDGKVIKKYASLTALQHFIQTHMPASDPGSLRSFQSRDLAIYIRSLNSR